MKEKTRWRIAYRLNRLPRQCWADLVGWALYGTDADHKPWTPRENIQRCRKDRDEIGCCYCGKYQQPNAAEVWKTSVQNARAKREEERSA